MEIEFGEYLPDLPEYKNPGATVAKNVIPGSDSYEHFKSAVTYSNRLSGKSHGAFSTRDNDGNSVTFAGTKTALYRLSQAVYSDVSKSGGYSTSDEDFWDFTRFGTRVIATNYNDPVQTYTLNTSSNFADLISTSNAPRARYVEKVRDFLVLGNTSDTSDGNKPTRLRWSAISDPTNFTVSATTQADFQDFNEDDGFIQRIIGGDDITIFQEKAITRGFYIGSPLVFQFDKAEAGRGTPSPRSVVKAGDIIFYLGDDGFYAFDGRASFPIGENKINRTFWREVNNNYILTITGVADVNKQIIYWSYATTSSSSGTHDKILCYNYAPNAKKRWSFVETSVHYLFEFINEGYTLDSLDQVSGSIDALPFSLDSRVWMGQGAVLSGFLGTVSASVTHTVQVNFTGAALNATLETGEFQLFPDHRADITLTRPIIDGTSVVSLSLQLAARNTQNEHPTYGSAVIVNSTGNCPVRSNGRYHRVRANIQGDFDHAKGIEIIKASKAGLR